MLPHLSVKLPAVVAVLATAAVLVVVVQGRHAADPQTVKQFLTQGRQGAATSRSGRTAPGATNWLFAPTDPKPSDGAVGSYAYNTKTNVLFRKMRPGSWSSLGDLLGKAGSVWFTGPAAPTEARRCDSRGQNCNRPDLVDASEGDFYFQQDVHVVWYYNGKAWRQQAYMRGLSWFVGAAPPGPTNPASAPALVNDFYVATATGYVYQLRDPNAATAAGVRETLPRVVSATSVWEVVAKMKGSTWYTGTYLPETEPAVKPAGATLGSMYLDTTTGDVYQLEQDPNNPHNPADVVWTVVSNTHANPGVRLFTGKYTPTASAPAGANAGDQYLDKGVDPVRLYVRCKEDTAWNPDGTGNPWAPAGTMDSTNWVGHGATVTPAVTPLNANAESTPTARAFSEASVYAHFYNPNSGDVWEKFPPSNGGGGGGGAANDPCAQSSNNVTDVGAADNAIPGTWQFIGNMNSPAKPWLSGPGNPNTISTQTQTRPAMKTLRKELRKAPLLAWYRDSKSSDIYQRETSSNAGDDWVFRANNHGQTGQAGNRVTHLFAGNAPASNQTGMGKGDLYYEDSTDATGQSLALYDGNQWNLVDDNYSSSYAAARQLRAPRWWLGTVAEDGAVTPGPSNAPGQTAQVHDFVLDGNNQYQDVFYAGDNGAGGIDWTYQAPTRGVQMTVAKEPLTASAVAAAVASPSKPVTCLYMLARSAVVGTLPVPPGTPEAYPAACTAYQGTAQTRLLVPVTLVPADEASLDLHALYKSGAYDVRVVSVSPPTHSKAFHFTSSKTIANLADSDPYLFFLHNLRLQITSVVSDWNFPLPLENAATQKSFDPKNWMGVFTVTYNGTGKFQVAYGV